MNRFALYSDIHGNVEALEAVFADIDASGIEERYCLGDLVGYGPDPSAVIQRVRESGDAVVAGNYDDGVGARRGGCGCYYPSDEARKDGEASYAWTDAALDDAEHAYLAGLPHEIRFEVEGLRVLLVHGSPRRLNEYLLLDRSEESLARMAANAQADVVCFGHVHIPYRREVRLDALRSTHFVSDGSVGKPKDGDPRACWTEVVIDRGAVSVAFHRVAYDVDAVARRMIESGLPKRLADALRRA